MAAIGQESAAAPSAAPAADTPAAAAASTRAGERSQDNRETESARPATADGQTLTPLLQAKMRVYRNLRYHEDRQTYYERLARWSNFFIVVLGSSAAALIVGKSSALAVAATAATTLLGSGQLVFDYAKRAREEGDLRRECAKLLAATDEASANPSSIEIDLADIYGREAEIYHAVNALAYNAAQQAYGRPTTSFMPVTAFQKWMRHFWTFDPSDFSGTNAPARGN